TSLAIADGEVLFSKAFFYLLKYVEYFIIYFLATNIIKTKKQVVIYILCFFITAIIVNIHGYSLLGRVDRLYAPFDAPHTVIGGVATGAGESNTYGGYLVLIISLALGLFCYLDGNILLGLGIFIIFSLIPLAYTLSRSSYLAFVVMFFTTIFFTEKKRMFLIAIMSLVIVLIPVFIPKVVKTVKDRIEETLVGPVYSDKEFEVMGIKIRELSALARVDAWQRAFVKFIPNRPILGHGVTGVGLVDTQIPLIIGEVGLIGLSVFFWILFTIYKESFLIFKTVNDKIYKALSLFLITTLTALLVQSVAANTFIIIRIMEPFWFLCGMVMVLSNLEKEEQNYIKNV
ncbi:MAG: O-antigen ligase family protein, partial [Bacteroidales bacterium]